MIFGSFPKEDGSRGAPASAKAAPGGTGTSRRRSACRLTSGRRRFGHTARDGGPSAHGRCAVSGRCCQAASTRRRSSARCARSIRTGPIRAYSAKHRRRPARTALPMTCHSPDRWRRGCGLDMVEERLAPVDRPALAKAHLAHGRAARRSSDRRVIPAVPARAGQMARSSFSQGRARMSCTTGIAATGPCASPTPSRVCHRPSFAPTSALAHLVAGASGISARATPRRALKMLRFLGDSQSRTHSAAGRLGLCRAAQ